MFGSRGSGRQAGRENDKLRQPLKLRFSVFTLLLCESQPPHPQPSFCWRTPAWFRSPFKIPTALCALITPAVMPRASLIAQYPFHSKVSQTAQKTFVPGQNHHTHLRQRAPAAGYPHSLFSGGAGVGFHAASYKPGARALSSGWSPPVSISAGRQVTRKFLPRTGAWAGRRLAFSPRSALRVSRNLFASRLISSLHEHGLGDTSPPSFCASAVPSAHPQGAVVLTARPDSEGHSVGNAARICSDHRTCSRHLRGL